MLTLTCLIALVSAGSLDGQVAFLSGDTVESRCVSVLDLATDGVTLIGFAGADGPPRWSPDGKWIAFETRTQAGRGIAVVRPDGTERTLLKTAQPWNLNPRWAPDSMHLAYSAGQGPTGLQHGIVVQDIAAGTEQSWGGGRKGLMRPVWLKGKRLLAMLAPREADEPTEEELALFAEWPEHSLLAVGLVTDGKRSSTDIFALSHAKALAMPMPGYVEWAVEASSGGKRAVFESNDGGDREIFVVSTKGLVDISNHRAADWNPVWAADRSQFAFESFRSGRRGVYRAFHKTPNAFPVAVSGEHDNWSPSWSPDSESLVFVSDRTGNPEIFMCGKRGKNPRQLTHSEGNDVAPAWCPVVWKTPAAWRDKE